MPTLFACATALALIFQCCTVVGYAVSSGGVPYCGYSYKGDCTDLFPPPTNVNVESNFHYSSGTANEVGNCIQIAIRGVVWVPKAAGTPAHFQFQDGTIPIYYTRYDKVKHRPVAVVHRMSKHVMGRFGGR